MKFIGLLYICIVTATFSSLTSTANIWYETASITVHSRMQIIEDWFLKAKDTSLDCYKMLYIKIRNSMSRDQLDKLYNHLKSVIKNLRPNSDVKTETEKKDKEAEKLKEEEEKKEL